MAGKLYNILTRIGPRRPENRCHPFVQGGFAIPDGAIVGCVGADFFQVPAFEHLVHFGNSLRPGAPDNANSPLPGRRCYGYNGIALVLRGHKCYLEDVVKN